MALSQEQVLNALKVVIDPDLQKDIVTLGFVKSLQIEDRKVSFTLELTTPACPVKEELKAQSQEAIMSLGGIDQVDVELSSSVRASVGASGTNLIPTIKNVVCIASGKGGVGKSTVTVNLAHALQKMGASVGIMDADVYGPSIPTILGVTGEPQVDEKNRIFPLEKDGIQVVSMGFFMDPDQAVIWRGPMLHKTVQQFLGGVIWGDLDYLLVDLPPGTGDIQLSLCQTIPISGAVIVSTPQPVALNVAQKAIAMFNKLQTPVLGLIENMASDVFGRGGIEQAATKWNIPYLGSIPLEISVREAADAGRALGDKDSIEAQDAFNSVAKAMAAQISVRALQGEINPEVKITF